MYNNPDIVSKLVQEGIQWLDVSALFKTPVNGGGERYQFNYFGRNKKSRLKVLVRNAVFENNMSKKEKGVESCMNNIEKAFLAKQPALISNHRASFVGGIDEKDIDVVLSALNQLLKNILQKWPDAEFISINELQEIL